MEKINYQEPFNLFDEIDQYVVDAIKEMPPEKVQKYVKWDGFIESVQRITFWIGYDENNSRVALDNTYYFARFAGHYLSTHYNERYMMYWKRTLESSFWSYKANIPEERIDDFLEARCIVKFNYIYGFIENGLDILVIDSFFCEAMANIFRLKEKYEVLLGLLVHCYLYYLSKRESEKVVTPEVRNCAERIVLHKSVKKVYRQFLERLCIDSSSLNSDMLKQMIKLLGPYERLGSHTKYMIIENVINEYYMFIILYLSNTYHMPGLLERNLDDDTYSGYVYENKAENTKQMLTELYTLIDDRESSELEIKAKVELMYDEFSAFEKKKFKEKQMKKAVQNQIQYIWNVDIEKVKNHIKQMTEVKLRENWKVIYTMLMENGLALKRDSIKVCIHSIEVEIRSQNISDEKQSYNKETGLYTYSIYSGMPIDFKENELEAFLHDNRKVIEISAKISVQTATERIGTLIVEK